MSIKPAACVHKAGFHVKLKGHAHAVNACLYDCKSNVTTVIKYHTCTVVILLASSIATTSYIIDFNSF